MSLQYVDRFSSFFFAGAHCPISSFAVKQLLETAYIQGGPKNGTVFCISHNFIKY